MVDDGSVDTRPSTPEGQTVRWTKFGDMTSDDELTMPNGYGLGTTPLASSSSSRSWHSPQDIASPIIVYAHESDVTAAREGVVTPDELDIDSTWQDGDHSASEAQNDETRTPQSQNIVIELPVSTLNNPGSCYDGFKPGAPCIKEAQAIASLLEVLELNNPDLGDFIEFDLSDFTIYLDASIYPNEMRPLHHLATRMASDKFYFDGILSVGERKYYLWKIPFRELPIGNYGSAEQSIGDQIWIRSEINRNKEIYYKLKKPSTEYQRYWRPFLWIADLAKHAIDYCSYSLSKTHRLSLDDFREKFSAHLVRRHKTAGFKRWHASHGSEDFRTAIVANFEFIWKEALGQPNRKIVTRHRFWDEIKGSYYIPMIPLSPLDSGVDSIAEDSTTAEEMTERKRAMKGNQVIAKTIVTPYIYDLFGHMDFDDIMRPVPANESVKNSHIQQIRETSSTQQTFHRGNNQSVGEENFITRIKAGDVISTPPDDEGTGTKWKRETSRHHGSNYVWYGMVQKVHVSPEGLSSFDVVWMYQSRDTPCALMKYPWPNELFLSDSCTCETARVDERDVLATHRVAWFGDPSLTSTIDFFVRQTYLAEERCWVTLDEKHLACSHHKKIKRRSTEQVYAPGDTVLAQPPNTSHLNAFIIERVYREGRKRWARLRTLLRRNEVDESGHFPANELVYSEQLIKIEAKRIVRQCLIRAFYLGEKIPAPYDRGGTGDAFYLTHQFTNGVIEPILDLSRLVFRQGFHLAETPVSQKLQGLDLFCGGGNFGRGIEDGGGVEMKWANDISSNAIHSYMANCKPDTCTPFLGSVDDLLERALDGRSGVPRPGEVHFISGGSPCQGFSRLTLASIQQSMKQRKNRSLVASFASFVDFFRPQYGLLENVQSMVKVNDKREECFFSQLVCSIVGMGYQVRIIYADAWSYGASQSRCRVFLSFAAPGVSMPKAQSATHSHPPNTRMGTLGKMSNGQPFGERLNTPTPFKFVSSFEAAGDLPDIRDGKADYCIGFPDHRICIGFTPRLRQQIRHIPTQPYGMGFDRARFGYQDEIGKRVTGIITDADLDYHFPNHKEHRMQPGTKGWGRVHPHGLFRTVVTVCGVTDRRTGFVNHWQQPRPLSVLEVRRAQGFLDHEIILGKPAQQWHVVGNSVARQVALALGLAIREAWFGTLYDEPSSESVGIQSINEFQAAPDFTYLVEGKLEVDSDAANFATCNLSPDPLGGPISTPATSVSDLAEAPTSLNERYSHKRHKSREMRTDRLIKRPRWGMGGM